MKIRKGKIADAEQIASLLLLAMEEIAYEFIGEQNQDKAKIFLKAMILHPESQYTYSNNWIFELDDEIVGLALLYDGALLSKLREPVAAYIQNHFGKTFNPENETQSGEYYIDCIAVSANHQGKGIGSKILEFLKGEYALKQGYTLGLLVDFNNPNAEKLYIREGFKIVGNKKLLGKNLKHLQYHLPPNS
ncbi:GNAT family N-acetyltransferase [Sphingobacterium sp. HJSM2_6]|uniref:GNAT family N-acetyltransferase n=1 Tax=Sphingobacterium sp. HJSM2_6 TaxID=3366264 RepID=UPI003BC7C93C